MQRNIGVGGIYEQVQEGQHKANKIFDLIHRDVTGMRALELATYLEELRARGISIKLTNTDPIKSDKINPSS